MSKTTAVREKHSLRDLAEQVVHFRNERDWKQFHTVPQMLLALYAEVAELCEHFQWQNTEEISAHLETGTEAVSEELADILYWVLLLARDMNIDLETAFQKKMIKNASKYPADLVRGRHKKYNEY